MTSQNANNSLPVDIQNEPAKPQPYDGSIGSSEQSREQVASPDSNGKQFDMQDDHERQRAMVGALLNGTFDENVRTHAENLAEKLILRQQELDRREAQLNQRSAEIANEMRQSRLNVQLIPHAKHTPAMNEPHIITQMVAEAEASDEQAGSAKEMPEATVAGETSATEELLAIRIDKYCTAQRQPYSRISARMKKYSGGKTVARRESTESETVPPAEAAGTFLFDGQLDPLVSQVAITDPVLLSINQLTDSAMVIRRRSEEIDAMYEQLTDIFSEMLRQQGAMRELTSSLSGISSMEEAGEIQNVRNELNRLTIQLTMVGRDHFLLPMETIDAA